MRRIYVYMHHKEVLLAVDTAKIILAAFPAAARLVIAGLSAQIMTSTPSTRRQPDGVTVWSYTTRFSHHVHPTHCLIYALTPDVHAL